MLKTFKIEEDDDPAYRWRFLFLALVIVLCFGIFGIKEFAKPLKPRAPKQYTTSVRNKDLQMTERAYLLPTYPRLAPEPEYRVYATLTAYNSVPKQTDSTPFITASGARTRWGIIASNWLEIGTLVKIPDLYGNQIFIVEDRMHERNRYPKIDIWMSGVEKATSFGRRHEVIYILDND